MKLAFAVIASSVLLASCGTVSAPSPVSLSTTFDRQEIAWSLVEGTNTIVGNAVLRTVGGDVKTCAGLEAHLVAASSYSRERIEYLYGQAETGFGAPGQDRAFVPDPPEYYDTARQTICDSQGNFTFERIPDGEYYVFAVVTWGAVQGGRYAYIATQGGRVMQKISVRGGETRRLVLSRQ